MQSFSFEFNCDIFFLLNLKQGSYRVTCYEKSSVHSFLRLCCRVMHNFLCFCRLLEFLVHHVAIVIDHGKIQRAKIRVKIVIDQFIVDAEEVSVYRALWFCVGAQCRKVKSI